MAKFVIQGMKEIDRALQALPDAVAKRVIKQAIRESLKPIRAAVRAETPVGRTGLLKKNIKIRSAKRTRKQRIWLDVGTSEKDYVGKQFYGAMVEFGHDLVRGGHKKSGGRVVGHVDGRHFMERAFESTAEAAKHDAETRIRAGIEAETAKLRKG